LSDFRGLFIIPVIEPADLAAADHESEDRDRKLIPEKVLLITNKKDEVY